MPSPSPSLARRVLLPLVILLTLFLLGTVVVLSTVTIYLAIPDWAYLSEVEVPWNRWDAIKEFEREEDQKAVEEALAGVFADMEERGDILRRAGGDEIRQYNHPRDFLPLLPRKTDDDDDETSPYTSDHYVSPTISESEYDEDLLESTDMDYEEDDDIDAWSSSEPEPEPLSSHPHPPITDDSEDDIPSSHLPLGAPVSTHNRLPPTTTPFTPTSSSDDPSRWSAQGAGSRAYYMSAAWEGELSSAHTGKHHLAALDKVELKKNETMPRIIHQTWKNEVLPPKWRDIWRECREGMGDYEYMLWTDDLSRGFIQEHYPSFLTMWDSYEYNIQRADAIRYFVLHKYGGIYMDLDIGCRRRLDTLLQGDWNTILPLTKPVGISNDLIFSSKGSPFMEQVINALPAFNRRFLTNYPTVMFSTGPMFLSIQYSFYQSAHPLTSLHPRAEIRVLPKSLYGKNALPGAAPHSYFSHFYGSSWHADDAGFITFLGTWGKRLMYLGAIVAAIGLVRFFFFSNKSNKRNKKGGNRTMRRFWEQAHDAQYQLVSLLPGHGAHTDEEIESGIPLHGMEPPSPSGSISGQSESPMSPIGSKVAALEQAFRSAGSKIFAAPASIAASGSGRAARDGVMYFLPAVFVASPPSPRRGRPRTASTASELPRTRRQSSQPSISQGSEKAHDAEPATPGPLPYEKDEEMAEVDSFLRDEEAGASGSKPGSRRDSWAAWDGEDGDDETKA